MYSELEANCRRAEVERQNRDILNTFTENKIKDESGQTGYEKLFKPVITRMEKFVETEEKQKVPDKGQNGPR